MGEEDIQGSQLPALWENLSQEVGSEYPHILGTRGRHQCRGQAIRR